MSFFHATLSEVVFLNNIEYVLRPDNSYMTLTLIVSLVSLISFIIVNQFNPRYLTELFSSAIYFKKSEKVFKDKNTLSVRASYGIDVVMIINFALLLYQNLIFLPNISSRFSYLEIFIISLAVVLGIIIVKICLYFIVGLVIRNVENTKEYISNVLIYYRIVGLALYPILVINAFAGKEVLEILFYVSIVLIITAFIAGFVRGIMVGVKTKFPYVYMFLYFCCLELLPFFIIIKVSFEQIN
jgi:hypothetical protein